MPNIETVNDVDYTWFSNEMASLLTPWGMPLSTARVYGYILLVDEPVSLDRIAEDLGMSKVSAWKAARELEEFGHIRRHGTAGSKRARYDSADNFATPLKKQIALLGTMSDLLQRGAGTASATTAQRLSQMAAFYMQMKQSMQNAVDDLESQQVIARDKARQSAKTKNRK